MSKSMQFLNTKAGAVVAIGVVGAIAVYFAQKKAGEAIAEVGNAINPVNQDNIFYSGVNAVGAKVTGKENFNLGRFFYDLTHDTSAITAPTPTEPQQGFWAGAPKPLER
jgi:hypothetical protein